MTHPVDRLQAEAQAAIAAMRNAALDARSLHARAELMRHMRLTAAKMTARPADEAAAHVRREWMNAWALDARAYPALSAAIEDFVRAFCVDAHASDAATQSAIDRTLVALEAGFAAAGTSLADQMAFRSECAHGWWDFVVPRPTDPALARPAAPQSPAGAPFWALGCPPHCRGDGN
jgi:hypothetical protein